MSSYSIQCTNCRQWVQKRCGVNGSLCKASNSFVCSVCLHLTDSEVKSYVSIGDSSNLELMDEFSYLGDMLSVDGDADAAVTTRICSGWFLSSGH